MPGAVPWEARLCSSQPSPFAGVLFCFAWVRPQPSLGGFPGQRSSRQLLKPCSPGHSATALQPRHTAGGSSMELWGAYLLLCLFSLLTQVTAEPPSPKVKKAANAKKDVVSPKMLEELKSQLESLAQEVALLKEQQALQTASTLPSFCPSAVPHSVPLPQGLCTCCSGSLNCSAKSHVINTSSNTISKYLIPLLNQLKASQNDVLSFISFMAICNVIFMC
ncbi:tetranectin isoform X2 [Myotis lucifugus]|uniref:tetranectin isoform X2 n=1 Tax=Myotis lucifugus TaxID=59463 RepID=UPI0006D71737|nr:tetranectin isoform X2 [Myotis lucifugus]